MHAQNCLFRALECSNRVHSDLDKLMEALFFIHGRRPGLEAAGRGTVPSPVSPASASAPSPGGGPAEAWEARCRGGHHSPRLLTQERLVPAPGGGTGGVSGVGGVVELISLATRLLLGWSERSPDAPSKPTMSP